MHVNVKSSWFFLDMLFVPTFLVCSFSLCSSLQYQPTCGPLSKNTYGSKTCTQTVEPKCILDYVCAQKKKIVRGVVSTKANTKHQAVIRGYLANSRYKIACDGTALTVWFQCVQNQDAVVLLLCVSSISVTLIHDRGKWSSYIRSFIGDLRTPLFN